MKRILSLLLIVGLPACSHLPLGGSSGATGLWKQAHEAFAQQDFERASALFTDLAENHPRTLEGRESLFYLGSLRLDPRNPAWDPQPAESALARYLALETEHDATIHRRPEGTVLLGLAQQLNMPPSDRVPGLQPEVVTREVTVPRRVVVPAQESRALAAEVERLRGQLAERDATIRQQREELERIRRTLTRPTQ